MAERVKKARIYGYGGGMYKDPYEYFIYARVSKRQKDELAVANGADEDTDEDTDDDIKKKESSLKSQIDTMKGIANRMGLNVPEGNIFMENKSGKKGSARDKFDTILDALEKDAEVNKNNLSKKKYGGILFWKVDRLARNFDDFARVDNLMDKGYKLISATETIENTYTGRLLFRILAGFAIYESEKLSARIGFSIVKNLIAKDINTLSGKSIIFGYKKDKETGDVSVDEKQAEIVNFIYKSYLENHKRLKGENGPLISVHSLTLNDVMNEYGDVLEKHIKKTKTETDAIGLIEKIIKNNHMMKYCGFVDFTVNVKDEIVRHLFDEVKEKYPEYEHLKSKLDEEEKGEGEGEGKGKEKKEKHKLPHMTYKGTGEIGTAIEFKFYVPELEVVDMVLYSKVQDLIGQKVDSKETSDKEKKENRRDESLFYGLVYFQNTYVTRQGTVYYKPDKETRHYKTEAQNEKDKNYDDINEELSEGKIEAYLWQSGVFNGIGNLNNKKHEKKLIKLLQIRQNLFELKNMFKFTNKVRGYELYLSKLKKKRSSGLLKTKEELERIDIAIESAEELKDDAQKMVKKEEATNRLMTKSLDKLTDPTLYAKKSKEGHWTKDITRDVEQRILRGLGYRLMIKEIRIEVGCNKLHVHFYDDIANILGLKEKVVNIQMPG